MGLTQYVDEPTLGTVQPLLPSVLEPVLKPSLSKDPSVSLKGTRLRTFRTAQGGDSRYRQSQVSSRFATLPPLPRDRQPHHNE